MRKLTLIGTCIAVSIFLSFSSPLTAAKKTCLDLAQRALTNFSLKAQYESALAKFYQFAFKNGFQRTPPLTFFDDPNIGNGTKTNLALEIMGFSKSEKLTAEILSKKWSQRLTELQEGTSYFKELLLIFDTFIPVKESLQVSNKLVAKQMEKELLQRAWHHLRHFHTRITVRRFPIAAFDVMIKPSQFHVGRPAIEKRKKALLEKDAFQIQEYLAQRPIPFVLGPNGKYWILDRHHLSTALVEIRADLATKGVPIEKIDVHFEQWANFKELDWPEFYRKMTNRQFIFPFQNGKEKSPDLIPERIQELTPDIWRGLAWIVRESGAYAKTPIPFVEFFWGEHYRLKLAEEFSDAPVITRNLVRAAIRATIKTNKQTEKLPGFLNLSLGSKSLEKATDSFMTNIESLLNLLEIPEMAAEPTL